MLDPEQARLRDARVKEKAMNQARRWREETKEDEMFMMEALHEGWAQLDREVDQIMNVAEGLRTEGDVDGATERNLEVLKARSRGKAEVLVLFMPHPFDTAEDIAKEAWLRWKARQDGEVRQTLTMHRTTPKGEGS